MGRVGRRQEGRMDEVWEGCRGREGPKGRIEGGKKGGGLQ